MRNTIKSVAAVAALALAGAASTAGAAVIYDNGPLNGQVVAFTINGGFAVEDSFVVSSAATANGADFISWNFSGDSISQVDYGIENGISYADDGTAAVTNTFLFTNGYGYDVYSNHISFPGVSLAPGTYYFALQNAVAGANGDQAYWDDNNGPSSGSQSGFGDLSNTIFSGSNSEAFDITGVPEPTTWALMLVGFGGMGAALRSRRRVSAATA